MTSPQVTRRNAWRRLPQALAKSAAAGFIAVAVSIGVCPDATAWGLTGHRVTAAIADKYLSFEARAAIREILETGESLAEAANFPDFMRSSDDPFWSKARPWHFVTVPKGKTYAEVRAPDGGDAFTALKSFSDTLKSQTSSLAEKRVALRFTVHIIGDLHQPLHNGNGLDSGGNDVKVKFFGADTSLHSVWDEGLIEQEKLSYTEWTDWLSAKITDDMARKWWNPDPLVWIAEATALRDKIYPANEELQFRYQFDHIATIREQLQKGGVRTAAYLNRLFSR